MVAGIKLQMTTLEKTLQERDSGLREADHKAQLLDKQLKERESDLAELQQSKAAVLFLLSCILPPCLPVMG